jgi:hypothetical protein
VNVLTNAYEKQRKGIEMEEFFRDCVKSCEKEIMKSHEMSQLSSKNRVSSSFFFELKRKKFMQEAARQPQGIGGLTELRESYPMKVLDRHTKNVIYKTIKRIIDNAKEEKKKAHIMSINLEWDEFRKFTPM